MNKMKIGLWNIDHPENDVNSTNKQKRFLEIIDYLKKQNCDVLILNESNSAIELAGYTSYFSNESPFLNKNRCYNHPNRYYQVTVLSKIKAEQFDIMEPINGVLCKIEYQNQPIFIYGNVITIKDRWKNNSNKKYKDRLQEQIAQFNKLLDKNFIIAGDFNLKKGWTQQFHVGEIRNNTEIILYRATCELINNTFKYAKAKNVLVKYNINDNELIMKYTDNGIGFNLNQVWKNKIGMGIFNMKNRISSLNGQFKVESGAGKGIEVNISVPLKD